MTSAQPPQISSAHSGESGAGPVKAFFEQWWQVVTTVGLALASLLTALGVENKPAQAAGALLAPVFVGVGVYFWRRALRRRKQADAEEEWRRHEQEHRGGRAAFRGSLSYRKGDPLPGARRGEEVRATADKIADAGFSFGVVTGGLGCGKTSLLDAGVRPALEESGFSVLFIPSPRQPRSRGGTADAEPTAQVRAFAKAVREQLPPAEESPRGRVLIVDQMEELFADLKAPPGRHEVGKLFEKLTRSGVRVVLGVRRDYFLDVYKLSEHIPSLVPHKNLFELDYFTPEEAEEVIRECAARDDRVSLDDGFPRAAAADLTKDDGRVRPVELQIVCTALRGALRLSDYRGAGGAGGILSKYVGATVETCPLPRAGRRLLRAACRFAERLKEDPQTADQFRMKVGLPEATPELVIRVIRHFEDARLLVRERDETAAPPETTPRYQLPHDYLIGSIADATRQEVTRAEEADQYLEYHLREKTVIPLARWWFIRRHADPARLSRPDAARLMRRSLFTHVGRVSGVAAALLLANLLLLGVGTAERAWQREVVGTHRPDGQLIDDGWGNVDGFAGRSLSLHPLGGDGPPRLLSGLDAFGNGPVRLWEVREGVNPESPRVGKVTVSTLAENCRSILSHDERFLLHAPGKGEGRFVALDLVTGKSDPTPIPSPTHAGPPFEDWGRGLLAYEFAPTTYKLWSLAARAELGSVSNLETAFGLYGVLTTDPPRLIIPCTALKDRRETIGLFDYEADARVAELAREGWVFAVAVDDRRGLVYTLEEEGGEPGARTLRLYRWGLADGREHPPRREFPPPPLWARRPREPGRPEATDPPSFELLRLVGDGRYLLVRPARGRQDTRALIDVLDPDTLASVLPPGGDLARFLDVYPPVLAWAVPGGVEVWDFQRAPAARPVLAGFDLTKLRKVVVSRDRGRLATLLSTGKLELWDLADGSRKREIVAEAGTAVAENAWIFDSLTGNCLCESAGPARIRLYDWGDGRLLADLTDVGGRDRVIHYDGVSRQVYVWSDRGDCVKYTEWMRTLGRFRLWRTGHD
jgi:hypothetical protein